MKGNCKNSKIHTYMFSLVAEQHFSWSLVRASQYVMSLVEMRVVPVPIQNRHGLVVSRGNEDNQSPCSYFARDICLGEISSCAELRLISSLFPSVLLVWIVVGRAVLLSYCTHRFFRTHIESFLLITWGIHKLCNKLFHLMNYVFCCCRFGLASFFFPYFSHPIVSK